MEVQFLNESLMPVSSLKNYVEKNCPIVNGWTAKSPIKDNWPLTMATHKKNHEKSFLYPDDSPGQWFVIGHMLFVSGRVLYKGHFDAAVFIYWMDTTDKVVSLHMIYRSDHAFIHGYPRAEQKMTNAMKRMMTKASTLKSWVDADDLFDNEMYRV